MELSQILDYSLIVSYPKYCDAVVFLPDQDFLRYDCGRYRRPVCSLMDSCSCRYSFVALIGSGMSSDVYLAMDRATKSRVAIKRISKSLDEKSLEKVRREIDIMKRISCPFIVSLYDSYETEDFIHIVMEYCPTGNLKNFIMAHGPLMEDPASVIFTELTLALQYLHKTCQTMHRDIKLDNILLDANGHVKLTDFGFSTCFDSEDPQCRTVCGSPAYASPELIMRNAYNSKTDVWSAGVALYTIVTGNLPFVGQNICDCMKRVVTEEPTYPESLTAELRHLLGKMLEKDSAQRYDVNDVLSHPWLTEGRLFSQIKAVSEMRFDVMSGQLDNEIVKALGAISNHYRPGADRLLMPDSHSQWFGAKALAVRPRVEASKSMRRGPICVGLGRASTGQMCPQLTLQARRRSIARLRTVSPTAPATFTICE